MTRGIYFSLLSVGSACGALLMAQTPRMVSGPTTRAVTTVKLAPPLPRTAEPASTDSAPGARIVAYSENDVVRVKAKVRYTTLLVLPKAEQIMDYTCGDKEFWIVNGTQNFAYVKPAKAGSQTNLNLITASGNVYSFVLTEVTEQNAEPDLKIFLEPKDESMLAALNGTPRFVPAAQLDDYARQVEIAKEQTRAAQKQAQETVSQVQAQLDSEKSRLRSAYPALLKHAYRFRKGEKPFDVTAMYHDGKFTYIQANPQETPALYEIKDGKPNLVNFQFRDGVYTVDKVLDSGYLAIGKKHLSFIRE